MKRFLVALLVGAALAGGAAVSQAQVLFTYTSSTVVDTPTVNGSTMTALPGGDLTPDNALFPGTDIVVGSFSVASTNSSLQPYSSGIHTTLNITGVSFPGVGSVTLDGTVSGNFSSTQSDSSNVTFSNSPQTVTIGGVNYTVSFKGFTPIGAPGSTPASFSFHVTAPRGVTSVPEPSTWAMLCTSGIGGLLFLRRRRA